MAASVRPVLGIDVGGSSVKGAPVNVSNGTLAVERIELTTPNPATPDAVADVVAQIAKTFSGSTGRGPIGIALPSVVKHGITRTAANVDRAWIDFDAAAMFRRATGRRCVLMNDAQAAAVAEVHFGAARSQRKGVVLLLTFGTGIGSGLVVNGIPVDGVELGHLRIDGVEGEKLAAASIRDQHDLTWKQWVKRVNTYIDHVEAILWPDLIVVGGGISQEAEKWVPRLTARTEVAVATLRNDAGIVGAAFQAANG